MSFRKTPNEEKGIMRIAILIAMCAIFFRLEAGAVDKPVDLKKLIAVAEKTGAEVVDDSTPDQPRLKLSYKKWEAAKMLPLKGSPYVVDVLVEDCSKVTDTAMAFITAFPKLEKLQLFKPALTSAALAPLKNHKALKNLTIADAKLGDKSISPLKSVDTLEELDLTGSQITDDAAETFTDLPNLKVLVVANTKFTGKGALQLKDMKNLKELNALNCEISAKDAMALEAAIQKLKIRR